MCSCQNSSPIEFFFLPFGRGVHTLASNLEAGCTSKCMHFPQIPRLACLLVLVLVTIEVERRFGYLLAIIYSARKLSKEKYIKDIDPLLNGKKIIRNCEKNNSRYIYTDENKEIFNEFVKKDEAIIDISSPYGTGKRKKLIPNFKKILFITYRQSLANSLYDE